MDYQTRSSAYQTVDIFSGITKRRLYLKNGEPRTDTRTIWAPFDSPHLYTYTEHELSHVLFKSDGRAKAIFVQDYARLAAKRANDHGEHIESRKIRFVMNEFCDILDDERCIGLWGLIYPGSEFTQRTLKYEQAAKTKSHSSLTSLFFAVAGGHDPGSGDLERFVPIFCKALKLVEHKDFSAVLITAKWLMTQMVDELLRMERAIAPNAPLPETVASDVATRTEALERALDGAQGQPKPGIGDVQEYEFASGAERNESKAKARAALQSQVKDAGALQADLDATKTAMHAIVEEVRSALRTKRDDNDRLRREAKAKVVFRDIGREDIGSGGVVLPPSDQDLVSRLRTLFHKSMGRRQRVLEDEGVEIDPLALITRRVTGEDMPVFRVDVPGRGFKALILIDRSSSMMLEGRTKRAERACRILSRAMKFPFVDSVVWGFQQSEDGQVDITRFAPGIEVFTTSKSRPGGNTPLHTAIHVAARYLEPGNEMKQLIVVSDGGPTFMARDGTVVPDGALLRFVRNEVRDARRRGIRVTGVILGERKGGQVVAEVGPKIMQFMFGPPKHWRIMDSASFDREFVRLVSGSFLRYLRAA